jgi:hypothetical protein
MDKRGLETKLLYLILAIIGFIIILAIVARLGKI